MAEPKEPKENLVQKNLRLKPGQVELIELLAKRQIFGTDNRSAVVRQLLGNALDDLVKTDYVKKYLETVALLKQPENK